MSVVRMAPVVPWLWCARGARGQQWCGPVVAVVPVVTCGARGSARSVCEWCGACGGVGPAVPWCRLVVGVPRDDRVRVMWCCGACGASRRLRFVKAVVPWCAGGACPCGATWCPWCGPVAHVWSRGVRGVLPVRGEGGVVPWCGPLVAVEAVVPVPVVWSRGARDACGPVVFPIALSIVLLVLLP